MNSKTKYSLQHSHDNWPCIDNYCCPLVTIGIRVTESDEDFGIMQTYLICENIIQQTRAIYFED